MKRSCALRLGAVAVSTGLLVGLWVNTSSALAAAPAAAVAGPSAVPDPVVVAAGDIACGLDDPKFAGTPDGCQMRATADQIAAIAPQYLLPLGDTQYASGPPQQGVQPSAADYQGSYNKSWGALSARVPGLVARPVPGNHEYGRVTGSTAGLTQASTYFDNFGPNGLNQLPPEVKGPATNFYSYNIPVNGGNWHVIALDSECTAVGGCGADSPQGRWLRNDLAANPNTCTLAYWHKPRWGPVIVEDDTTVAPLWNALVDAKTTMVLNGHGHNYQHLRPLDAAGSLDPAGVTQFTVGTGGEDKEPLPSPEPRTFNQYDQGFGVLKLTLHSSSASFAYQTVNGGTPESGTLPCATPPSASVPTVSDVTPISGPSGGGSSVVVTGTNFAPGVQVGFGGVAATGVQVQSATRLIATAPAFTGAPAESTVGVTVSSAAGTSTGGSVSQFTYTMAHNGYQASITASSGSAPVGGSVTLTATSNQDVGPTPYGLSIVDAATNVELARAPGGFTRTVTVSQTEAASRRYIARIDNLYGRNVQSVSTPVVVEWGNAPQTPPSSTTQPPPSPSSTTQPPPSSTTQPPPSPSPSPTRPPGALMALAPFRVLDTRYGNGAPARPVGPGASVAVQITGSGGIPTTGVSAVVINIAVTEPTAPGYLTAWAEGTPRPGTSNLNFVPGQTVPNLVIVPVSPTTGKIQLYNSAGNTHIVGDITGYYRQ